MRSHDDDRRAWPYPALPHSAFLDRDHHCHRRCRNRTLCNLVHPLPLHGHAVSFRRVSDRLRRGLGVHCGHLDRKFVVSCARMAFLLAHLSDPHLAPLPSPGFGELAGKRVTGYLNWQHKRRFVHDARVLDALVADLKKQKPDHIAVTGDLANIALAQEFARGREWLEALGDPSQVSLVPGNHDAYVREGLAYAAREWNDYMRGDDGSVFPYVR